MRLILLASLAIYAAITVGVWLSFIYRAMTEQPMTPDPRADRIRWRLFRLVLMFVMAALWPVMAATLLYERACLWPEMRRKRG